MGQKTEIDVDELYGLVYTWVRHVGIKKLPEGMDEESFIFGAGVFLEKLRELIPKEEEVSK